MVLETIAPFPMCMADRVMMDLGYSSQRADEATIPHRTRWWLLWSASAVACFCVWWFVHLWIIGSRANTFSNLETAVHSCSVNSFENGYSNLLSCSPDLLHEDLLYLRVTMRFNPCRINESNLNTATHSSSLIYDSSSDVQGILYQPVSTHYTCRDSPSGASISFRRL